MQILPKKYPGLLVILAVPVALAARLFLDYAIVHQGFFVGQAADTFLRTERSWLWSRSPFWITDPPIWPPLQYAIVGTMYWLASPLRLGSDIAVPIVANHIAFAGSTLLLFVATRRLAGSIAAMAVSLVACFMTYDVWMTLSGQVEPILTLFSLLLAYLMLLESEHHRPIHLITMGAVSFLLEATHYSGWFVALSAVVLLLARLIQEWRSSSLGQGSALSATVGLVLAGVFPVSWFAASLIKYGDVIAFLHWTAETHASYASMPMWERILSFPLASFDAAPALSILALLAIPLAIKLDRRVVSFLWPFAPQAILLSLSNILLLGPTRFMPRAALPALWASLLPVGVLLETVRHQRRLLGAALATATLISFFVLTTRRTLQFTNRITDNLRATAAAIAQEFSTTSVRVTANAIPWTQTHAMAVLSLAPNRIDFKSDEEMLGSTPIGGTEGDLLLFNDPRLMGETDLVGQTLVANEDYILVRPAASGDQIFPLSSAENPWTSSSDNTFLLSMPGNTYGLGFRYLPAQQGSVAEAHKDLHVTSHGCYILHFEIKDYAPESDVQWQYLHQVVANGIVIWTYDPTALSFDGWQEVDQYFMPSTSDIRLSVQVLALSQPNPSIDWWHPSELGFRSVSLGPCP